MREHHFLKLAAAALLAVAMSPLHAIAQGRPDPMALMAVQRDALAKLAFMDGVWRGPASTVLPNGDKHAVMQTERIGPLLGGTVKLIEGRGYDAEGRTGFNAFAVLSYNVATKSYNFRSYAQGFSGDYVFNLTDEGFNWEIPAGPATLKYSAVVKNGEWRETGDRVEAGKPPVRFFEMNLKRIGGSDWPGAGEVGWK